MDNTILSSRANASINKWYSSFESCTIKSEIINVPGHVLDYLNEDGVVLPVEAICVNSAAAFEGNSWPLESSGSYVTTADEETEIPMFPEFSSCLNSVLSNMGGKVFIKANWNAPLDASWIMPNKNVMCTSLEDIYLLIKSSSRFIDNFNSLEDKSECCIALRKWQDIHPGSEFRCFVYNKLLIGITQRNCSEYFEYIPDAQLEIIADITDFYKSHIKDIYQERNYTFDVVRLSSGTVILVDFGIFKDTASKPHLFTWEALLEIGNTASETDQPEFRYIASTIGIQPSDGFTGFCAPFDLNYGSANNREVVNELIKAFEQETNTDDESKTS